MLTHYSEELKSGPVQISIGEKQVGGQIVKILRGSETQKPDYWEWLPTDMDANCLLAILTNRHQYVTKYSKSGKKYKDFVCSGFHMVGNVAAYVEK